MASLVGSYGSSSEDEGESNTTQQPSAAPVSTTPISLPLVNIAPSVVPTVLRHVFFGFHGLQLESQEMRRVDPKTKEIFYNPTVEELFAPQVPKPKSFLTLC